MTVLNLVCIMLISHEKCKRIHRVYWNTYSKKKKREHFILSVIPWTSYKMHLCSHGSMSVLNMVFYTGPLNDCFIFRFIYMYWSSSVLANAIHGSNSCFFASTLLNQTIRTGQHKTVQNKKQLNIVESVEMYWVRGSFHIWASHINPFNQLQQKQFFLVQNV